MNHILFLIFTILSFSISIDCLTQKIPKEYEVAPWYGFKTAAITYSFDDGTSGHLKVAVPLLDKYNFKGSFNLITQINNNYRGFKAAAKNGHEIASHTITHPNLKDQDREIQTQELKESKKTIEKNIDQECVTLVYPYCVPGDYDIAKKYYISARGCSGQYIEHNTTNMFDLSSFGIGDQSSFQTAEDLNNLVKGGLEQKKWTVFLIHGIDDDGGYSPISSLELEKHFEYVAKNDFWVATFRDVSKYILEANSLVIEESTDDEGNTVIDVSVEYKTTITKLDVPVTVSRLLDAKCPKVSIIKANDLLEIKTKVIDEKVIFDVIPNEKYIMTCE